MRLAFGRLRVVLTYVGTVLFVLGLLLLVPFFLSFVFARAGRQDVRTGTFIIPLFISIVLGSGCRWQLENWPGPRRLGRAEAMLICVIGWLVFSALGAIPFAYHLGISYLDAYFEAMSGFTTTGITMLHGLDAMPRSLLFWRSMTEWVGGLGILTFFLVIVFQGGISYGLFGAESHKIAGPRIAPGMWNTLRTLWLIYVLYTLLIAGALYACGLSVFDSVCHSLACLATGGYSTHDASIAYYEQAGYAHHVAVEYIIIFGMWAGGINFFVHYRLAKGQVRALWDSDEVRTWWLVLGVSLLLVFGSRLHMLGAAGGTAQAHLPDSVPEVDSPAASFRHSLFQVMSIATTTGYGTRDIASNYFAPLARQVFLVLMIIGGCAGSTSGGLKVARIVILWKLMAQQVGKVLKPDSSVELLLVDRKQVDAQEVYRTAGLFFAWLFLLLFGALTTAALSGHNALASASGMFSALGNIGPCYIPVQDMARLSPVIKLVYIAGMLAGRLEVIPVLMLFTGRAWK